MAHDLEITDVRDARRALCPIRGWRRRCIFISTATPGQKVKINVKEGSKILASQEVTLKDDGVEQIEPVLFNAGPRA